MSKSWESYTIDDYRSALDLVISHGPTMLRTPGVWEAMVVDLLPMITPPEDVSKATYDDACPRCGEPFTSHGGERLECPV